LLPHKNFSTIRCIPHHPQHPATFRHFCHHRPTARLKGWGFLFLGLFFGLWFAAVLGFILLAVFPLYLLLFLGFIFLLLCGGLGCFCRLLFVVPSPLIYTDMFSILPANTSAGRWTISVHFRF
jgi:hypothetical protein